MEAAAANAPVRSTRCDATIEYVLEFLSSSLCIMCSGFRAVSLFGNMRASHCCCCTTGELVLNRDKREQSHGQGQKYIPRSHNSEKSGMRRPQAHASHAFRKPKGRNGDIDKSRDLNEQPEHKDSTGRRRPADFTDVPPDSRSSRRDMAATTQPDQPRAAASTTQGNANLSAAAQLKARLRGVPAAELATPQTVCCWKVAIAVVA